MKHYREIVTADLVDGMGWHVPDGDFIQVHYRDRDHNYHTIRMSVSAARELAEKLQQLKLFVVH